MDPFHENQEDQADFIGRFSVPDSVKATYRKGKGPARHIKVRNFSRAGICIEDVTSHPVGTSLLFHLNIQGKVIEAQGEVSWNVEEDNKFVHGIRFTFLPSEVSEWFNTFVMDWAAEQLAQELDFTSLLNTEPIERRCFARLKVPLKVEFGFNEETMLLEAQIYDISEGGLCLISNFELKVDQDLCLRLWLSDTKFLSLRGAVRYGKKKNFENRIVNFQGVEFTLIHAAALEELKQFLAHQRARLDAIELTLDEIISKQTDLPELP